MDANKFKNINRFVKTGKINKDLAFIESLDSVSPDAAGVFAHGTEGEEDSNGNPTEPRATHPFYVNEKLPYRTGSSYDYVGKDGAVKLGISRNKNEELNAGFDMLNAMPGTDDEVSEGMNRLEIKKER